ncbi:hypothetical protein O4J56_09595 [Nocardiopsis sp. RSe5-2]|uniref:DUF1963 domain-containing protein n=1 Tax=Nocardiopsis endophytica TaxID=3018445 RepID=A0ABT4U1R4_9ACTN|nr:hypothetical protein [Nocardiopsis endophytica]MDA2810887.1 hypothetical protein [Nocardiopsis endophytica]
MNTTRTTPPRPVDVAAAFPWLAPLGRTAYRLHPRPGAPTPQDSSVGGPLLWPARQPWPTCDLWHEGPPCPLVPIAQVYARDVPLLRSFGRADLLQVLWCPSEHPPDFKLVTQLFWRNAADVTDVLTDPPEPSETEADFDHLVPEPCVLAPEPVTEYPNLLELSGRAQRRLKDPETWRAAGVAVDGAYEGHTEYFYADELSMAPGWKLGGWAPWGRTDPVARYCHHCGARMAPLLTIASTEWDGDRRWVAEEDRDLAAQVGRDASSPAGIQIADNDNLQIYVCPTYPGAFPYPGGSHGHTELVQ